MINIKELGKALKQVAEEKGLKPEEVLEAIESSIAAAYKKEYAERGAVVKCKLDMKTGELNFWQVKTVVDETTIRFVEEKTEEEIQKEEQEGKKKSRRQSRSQKNSNFLVIIPSGICCSKRQRK